MNLQEFLNNNPIDNLTGEVYVSPRFKDENGRLLAFKIRSLTSNEYEDFRKQSMKLNPAKKTYDFNPKKFNELIALNCTIDPNFKDAKSIEATNSHTPEGYINKTLLVGEISRLANEITALSGFNTDMNELREEAKN